MSRDGPATKRLRPTVGYNGFRVPESGDVPVSADANAFFHDFIETRRPALLKHQLPIDIEQFTLGNIEERLQYEALLQVEHKVAFGFGLGTRRELKTFAEIVDRFKQGDDRFYLTTQYDDVPEERESDSKDEGDAAAGFAGVVGSGIDSDAASSDDSDFPETFDGVDDFNALNDLEADGGSPDNDQAGSEDGSCLEEYVVPEHKLTEEDVRSRVKTLLQPPLTNLIRRGELPIVPDQFRPLVTQQINLWMGCTASTPAPDLKNPSLETLGKYVPRGNSSGLHHDYADNLYVLVEGRKRFTIFLPADAEKLYTLGNVREIYANGLIDYVVDENAPYWRPLRADGAIISDWAEWKLEQNNLDEKQKTLLEQLLRAETERTGKSRSDTGKRPDPPSFCKVPPLLAHLGEIEDRETRRGLEEFAEREFPGFLLLKKLKVWLNPGDMLYLPAGWFHEVTSFGGPEKSQHVALNWWFVPPTGPASRPYEDEYWMQDFRATLAALEWTKQEKSPE
ncbi:Clavaminate synthase-like protein [Metschnikowia bicuspidata]|uniref:Clavaminate synthase-like protein n=1 Tax=Metschnikowia bicuspidata TaxID=27322 RepID=A0A4P9ZEW7_9ASCO|nr:Clavaminate synthase-like protein [Metschnikowia bicuspidata]